MKKIKAGGQPKNDEIKDANSMREAPFFIILSCGLVILAIGIYMTVSNGIVHGNTFANRFGRGGNHSVTLTGPGIIFVGIIVLIVPVTVIISLFIEKVKKKHNRQS